MPLIKPTLEAGIKLALQAEFKSPAVKLSLIKLLDKSPLAGAAGGAKDIYKALDNVEKLTEQIMSQPADKLAPPAAKLAVKKFTSNEWSNAIAEGISEWMSKEIAPIIAKTIADQVDTYIKSATIIVPPGITIAGGGGGPAPVTGATIAPSAPATIT
jgi:hypothetical protein